MEQWIIDCDFLAPYLKEKLEQDKEHTWRDAPYIPDDVRALLREAEPRRGCSFYSELQSGPNTIASGFSAQDQSIDVSTLEMQANISNQQQIPYPRYVLRTWGGDTFTIE